MARRPKSTDVVSDETQAVDESTVEDTSPQEMPSQDAPSEPEARNPFADAILWNMAENILNTREAISAYNAEVLASKEDTDSWTPTKLVAQAKAWARPEDASQEQDKDADNILRVLEAGQDAVNKARMQLAEYAAKKLNVSMTSDRAKRDDEKEEELKGLRTKAVALQKMMQQTAEFAPTQDTKDQITTFLENNDIPQIGREGTFKVSAEGTGTPKYRVDVTATKDGTVLWTEKGFTKASLSAKKFHPKGESPDSDAFRKAWEEAGNKSGETKVATVSLEYQGIVYTLKSR